MKTRNYFIDVAVLFILVITCCISPVKAGNQDDFEVLRNKFDSWLGDIKDSIPIVSSNYVNDWIIKNWQSNQEDYQLISVRSHDSYVNKGHISQAINIPYEDILTDENLEKLDDIKTQIIYSDNGYRSTTVSTILNLIDYHSYSMKFGMLDWNTSHVANRYILSKKMHKVVKGKDKSKTTYQYPPRTNSGKPLNALVKQRFNEVLATGQFIISIKDVEHIIDNWEKYKDSYQIISVRETKDFIPGHIPHAINIPWHELMHDAQLKRIDPAKNVVLYCYTGHLAQLSATLLNMLGYKTVNMRYGMMGWNSHFVSKKVVWDGVANYPVAFGSEGSAMKTPNAENKSPQE